MNQISNWKEYEDWVFGTLFEKYPEYSYQRNIRVEGRITKVKRQIDIAFNGTILGHEIFGVVDCKNYSKKVDVKDVESFISFLEDVGADIGILVTNHGYSKAAQERAKFSNVKLDVLTPEELEDYVIEFYICEECDPGEDHIQVIEWHNFYNLSGDIDKVLDIGRCDWCNTIHIKCSKCGEITAIPDADYGEPIECEGGCGTSFLVETSYESKGTEEVLTIFSPDS